MLYHISEKPDIGCFEPRLIAATSAEPLVWAVEEGRLANYLLPRDCPRVTFYAGASTSPEDRERFLGHAGAGHVVAIEAGWMPAVRAGRLYVYELPSESFVLKDEIAGYWVSRRSVTPTGVRCVEDILVELLGHGVELRIMPTLWPLRDAVAGSTLAFSIIRMRNAKPRIAGDAPAI
jgi:hypothetical protein